MYALNWKNGNSQANDLLRDWHHVAPIQGPLKPLKTSHQHGIEVFKWASCELIEGPLKPFQESHQHGTVVFTRGPHYAQRCQSLGSVNAVNVCLFLLFRIKDRKYFNPPSTAASIGTPVNNYKILCEYYPL